MIELCEDESSKQRAKLNLILDASDVNELMELDVSVIFYIKSNSS